MTYFIDGDQVKNIKDIVPEEIESMSVWKDENRVEITTKAKAGKQGKPTIEKVPGNLLYIVDGVTVDKNEFEKLEPDQIESMSILKGKDETEGIIKVTTRAR